MAASSSLTSTLKSVTGAAMKAPGSVLGAAMKAPGAVVGTVGKVAHVGLEQANELIAGRGRRNETATSAPASTPSASAPATKPEAEAAPKPTKKTPANKTAGKKAPATKTAAKKSPAKKSPAKKAAPKRTAATRAPSSPPADGINQPVDVVAELDLTPTPVPAPRAKRKPPVTKIDAEATPELFDATPAVMPESATDAAAPTESH